MKKSSFILALAAVLLGLMYWQRPKPPASPPQSQTTTTTLATTTNKTLAPVEPRLVKNRKPKPVPAVPTTVTKQNRLKTPIRPLPEVLQALPAYLKPLVERPRYPSAELRAQMTTNDQAILVELYLATTNLVDRNALTMALGFIGDEEVVTLFKQALTQEYPGRPLTSGYPGTDEEYTLFNTVTALGFLAAKYDSAYEFVKQGTDPWFWHDQIQWASNRGSETEGMLTSFSIQAVGQSGRSEVPQILEQMKTKDLVNRVDGDKLTARNFAGSVVEAACNYDLIQQYGIEAFRGNFYTERSMGLYLQWKKTENGKKWMAWYQTAKRQR